MARPATVGKHGWRPKNNGFVLLENLISIILVGMLAIGVFALFTLLDQRSRLTGWEQKAVLVLHGHMEKVVALYRYGEIPTISVNNQSRGYPVGHETPQGNHTILTPQNDPYLLMETDGAQFVSSANNNEGMVFYYSPAGGGGSSPSDRNMVWLDKSQRVAAMLSWTSDASVLPQLCYDGATGSPCRLLTLYLDFPYRLNSEGVPIPLTNQATTFSLRTIVGAR